MSSKQMKVFFRHTLYAEALAAIERNEKEVIPLPVVSGLPDKRFPIYLSFPLDPQTERCTVCLSETEVGVLDVSRETFDNLPSIVLDSQ